MDDKPCIVALALNDTALSHRYAATLSEAGYNVRVMPLPFEMPSLNDVDILVVEVSPTQLEQVAVRLRMRRGLFRGVIVGLSNAAVSPERRRIAVQAGFSELLCGPCGPDALLILIERLRTIRADDPPCEPAELEKPEAPT